MLPSTPQKGVTSHFELEFGAFPVSDFYTARKGKAVINFGCSVSNHQVHETSCDS